MAILSEDIDFKKNVGTAYNKTASIVVTWTVRIEGDSVSANPATACSPFHGTTSQKFPGGDALTMLYIKDRGQVGRSVSMTFPDFPDRSSYNPYPPPPPPPSHDPTTTGSVTLTAKDFGGTIPDKFTLEVRWMNDTYGAEITSPANMRNMTITILPIGK